jgi:adenylate cyclase
MLSNSKEKKRTLFFLSIGISLIVIFLAVFNIGNILELKLLDWRFTLRGEHPTSENVFIVAMGDESVSPEAVGRWPWRRIYMAILLDIIKPYNPDTVIFDILFTEPSEGEQAGDDYAFAEQAMLMGNVYFPFYGLTETDKEFRGYKEKLDSINEELVEKISIGRVSDFKKKSFVKANRVVMPIPLFSREARGSGYVNAIPDSDGVTRRVPLVMQYNDYLVPNVAFYAALNYLGVKKEDIEIKPGKYILLKTADKKIKIPVDKQCQMLANHPGDFSPDNIPMTPFVSIIDSYEKMIAGEKSSFDLNELKDKIMFIGLTATGTSDLRPTPFTPLFPMVGFLATISSNIIEKDFLIPVPGAVNYLIILIAGLIASFITIRFRAIPSALLNIIFILIYSLINFMFFKNQIVVSAFYPFASVVLSYAAITVYRFTGEEKEKKAIKGTFQKYVSSKVVDVLLDHPEQIKLGGERKRLSVFFSDIRGFTSMSEQLEPEEVVHILNEYLTEMIDIIFKYNGTLDKFIGDAVMAIWGAPTEQENHAELAVRAAWEMREKVEELREKWESEGEKTIGVGMGVNTGDVVVGNMGSDQFSDYTVIGDNVNLAARLEENAKAGELIITETTYEEVKNFIEAERLEPLKVKGKERPVQVYKVTGLK